MRLLTVSAAAAVLALALSLWFELRPSAGQQTSRAPASGEVYQSGGNDSRPGALPPTSRRADGADSTDGADQAGADQAGADQSDDGSRWEPGEEAMGWDRWLGSFVRPLPGETFFEYRDRMVPVAQTLVAPQRRRVAAARERFIEAARLDEAARLEHEALVARVRDSIIERTRSAIFSGELIGPDVRPMNGVRFARDILDMVVNADSELRSGLNAAQLAALDASRFDLAEFLLVATRWETLFGYEE